MTDDQPPSPPQQNAAGGTDFRSVSALPDITEISAFYAGDALKTETSPPPKNTLSKLFEGHFWRLRNTLLLALRCEFEASHLLSSSVGPLRINPVLDELRPEHMPPQAKYKCTGAAGDIVESSNDTEARRDGPDRDTLEDTNDNSKKNKSEKAEEGREGGGETSSQVGPSDEDSDGDSDEDSNSVAFLQLYQNHLCLVVSNGRVLAIGKYNKTNHRVRHREVYVPASSPSNIQYRIQRQMNLVQLNSIVYFQSASPTWRVLPVLQALQTRTQLPLSEELITYSLDPPSPVVPPVLSLLLGALIQNNHEFVYDMLRLRLKFRKARISERSAIAACIPAFNRRVTLYKQRPGK